MITCPQCDTPNPDTAEVCTNCGTTLSAPAGDARAGDTTVVVDAATAKTAVIAAAGDNTNTQPLMQLPPFSPLPEGAVIGAPPHEYRVENLVDQAEKLHTYQVTSMQQARICPNCGYLYNPAGEPDCRHCAASLAGAEPAHLRTTLLESAHLDAFAVEGHLVETGLTGPALRLPPAVLTKRVGGQDRRYLINAPAPAGWLDQLEPPHDLAVVLEWGVTLAQALAALHENQVVFGPFEGRRISLVDGRAALAEFSRCIYPGREAQYQQDIRRLAEFLLYLHTGKTRYSHKLGLPEPVEAVLLRALREGDPYPTAAAFGAALDEVLADIRRPVSVDFIIGRKTNVGRVRKLNEDSMLTLELMLTNQSVSRPLGLFAVADGMGGHSAGEVASGTALAAVRQSAIHELLTIEPGGMAHLAFAQWVQKATQAANTAVHDQVLATKNDMGTTLVVALVVENQAFLANVGDSRAYLVTNDSLQQVTVDHSLVERLVATGQITAEEARYHPQRNVIYRTIGDKADIEADTWEIQLQAGDMLLLCSDGLSGMVPDPEILRIIQQAASPQAACDLLVQAANEAGGTDNITAILVQVEETT